MTNDETRNEQDAAGHPIRATVHAVWEYTWRDSLGFFLLDVFFFFSDDEKLEQFV